MNITSFNPLIVSSHADDVIALFEALGFERRHTNEASETITNVTLRDAAGHQVDVATGTQSPQDLSLIRMNVSDFDEAYELLCSHGFTCPSHSAVETPSSKSTLMRSPSGFGFDLCQHLK